MKPTLIFKTDNKNVKKPTNLKNGVFLIYAPKKFPYEPMQFVKNDTEVTVTLPKVHRGYFTSKFRHDEIEIIKNQHQRIWIGILNRSLSENIGMHKNEPFGLFASEPDTNININIKRQQQKKGQKQQQPEKNIKKK